MADVGLPEPTDGTINWRYTGMYQNLNELNAQQHRQEADRIEQTLNTEQKVSYN